MDQQSYMRNSEHTQSKSILEGSQVAACVMLKKYLSFMPPVSLQCWMENIMVIRMVWFQDEACKLP